VSRRKRWKRQWSVWRWDRPRRDGSRLFVSVALDEIPLPRVAVYWHDSTHVSAGLSFGTKGSDQIILIDFIAKVPAWLARCFPG
jgi:hypothetical protein